jgi:ferritin-like metal-binding protein YciE
MPSPVSERLQKLFIIGLRNAHALEKQALSIMTPQVSRIEHYPELADRLQSHIEETHGQISRLEEVLSDFGESHSTLKDMALGLAGGMAAIGHSLAGDEILKNSFANYAFENFEIASYKSLITMAEDGGFARALPLLQQTLGEEQSMAEWMDGFLPIVTRRYIELSADLGPLEARS